MTFVVAITTSQLATIDAVLISNHCAKINLCVRKSGIAITLTSKTSVSTYSSPVSAVLPYSTSASAGKQEKEDKIMHAIFYMSQT